MSAAFTPQAFAEKWRASTLKESAAYQEHFNDLCRMLNHPTPAEKDPTGSSFTFQKGVTKELAGAAKEGTLFGERALKAGAPHGFADVWYKGHFAWEYKGKGKDLAPALDQLLQYQGDLENPELLVVCNFDRYEVHTRFNNCIKTVYRFTNDDIPKPETLRTLKALFENPDALKPTKTVQAVTEEVARQFAKLSESLRSRGVDAHAAAHFLMKLLFCMFAEDTGLLPQNLFQRVVEKAVGKSQGLLSDPHLQSEPRPSGSGQQRQDESGGEYFARQMELLFRAMRTSGEFWGEGIDHFNGGLFEDDETHELDGADLELLYDCSKQDWSSVEPSIFGTLFERSLDPARRSQIGAHYTGRADIETLVEPVLMSPLRREWEEVKTKALAKREKRDEAKGKGKEYAKRDKELRKLLEDFAHRLSLVRVLDPACGSGNFLYVALHLLKNLEKEVITLAAKCGFRGEIMRFVGPEQLYGIEINPYAAELARLVVWIGHIQWDKNNGLYRAEVPILKPLENIQEMDAILQVSPVRAKESSPGQASRSERRPGTQAHPDEPSPVRAKEARVQATEPPWPECDVIVGNPPFLGGKLMRRGLGDEYMDALFKVYEERVPHEADLCCYWFEKARAHIKAEKCKRAGLLATQGIRGGANREVLKRIKETGDIFFAVSDREWVLDGANVHISMVAFDDGCEKLRMLDGREIGTINANLGGGEADITAAGILPSNARLSFMGVTKVGAFDVPGDVALKWLQEPNPNGKPNSDVVFPWTNGVDVTRHSRGMWLIHFGMGTTEVQCAGYEAPFAHLVEHVKPSRGKKGWYRDKWWELYAPRPELARALSTCPRYIATPRVTKHRMFVWTDRVIIPDCQLIIFARSDDYFFGVLHSRLHEVWARAQGTQLRERESGFRYTPTTCFETFPLPQPTPEQESAIAAAAKELDQLRNNWLNPPEWTTEEVLEFPGSVNGPWARFVVNPNEKGIGTVRYPRVVPKDAECAAKLAKRTLTNLYNERPTWLDLAHKKLDAAVSAAYGWPADLSDEEILKRLLELNLARAGKEAKQE